MQPWSSFGHILCPFLLVNPSNPPCLLHIQIHYNLVTFTRTHYPSNPPLLVEVQKIVAESPHAAVPSKKKWRHVLKHGQLARRLRRKIGLGSALRKGRTWSFSEHRIYHLVMTNIAMENHRF